jgi:hypothetical protein
MFVSYVRGDVLWTKTPKQKEKENDAIADPADAIKEAFLRKKKPSRDAAMGQQLCEMHRVRRRARIIATALLVAFAAAATVLVVYLVFRPLKPQASVVRAAVYHMAAIAGNSSGGRGPPPYTLAASARFTAMLHNPSDRATVSYDSLFAYVTYRGEMVAPPMPLPGAVQERGADVALSPRFGLGGAVPVPVSAETAQALEGDCAAHRVELRLVVMGRVKYRSGPLMTGWRALYLRCDVTVGLGVDAAVGDDEAGDMPLLEYPKCSVDA